jgi:CelD/BcsL family acetyltransferase involved in cellulose biosynthesis
LTQTILHSEPSISDAPQSYDPSCVQHFNPLDDPRWRQFLDQHPRASVFHSSAWLDAIRRTFGHQPQAATTTPAGVPLRNALVYFRIESWLTGRRLVSLPFSDHCDPLLDRPNDLPILLNALQDQLNRECFRFAEIRPAQALDFGSARVQPTQAYCFHEIALNPNLDTLFHNFHKSSTQRVIRRAEREGLQYAEGQSDSLLNSFFNLMLGMRRRHLTLPHPKKWFRNLIQTFGPALKIRVALYRDTPIASILTLRFKSTLVYKYGASDPRYHRFGGMHLLYWQAIQEAKRDSLATFDLGRSDLDDSGLITFKEHWGARRFPLTYYRLTGESPLSQQSPKLADAGWPSRLAKRVLPLLPDRVLCSVSKAASRHLG